MNKEGGILQLWKNPSPNAISCTRSLSLIRAVESPDIIEKDFNQLFNCINSNEQFSLPLPGLQHPITLTLNNMVSRIDGKLAGILQGDFGSRKCHYCDSSEVDRNNTIQILQCFAITKSYESCMEAWQKLVTGEIQYIDPNGKASVTSPLYPLPTFAYFIGNFGLLTSVYLSSTD